MALRGLRGATVVERDCPDLILAATQELLGAILTANPSLKPEDLACVFFTVTNDLQSTYPAKAARQLGWINVPMMCSSEIPVPDGLSKCIRVLLLWNTDLEQIKIHHAYLGIAVTLRPDLNR